METVGANLAAFLATICHSEGTDKSVDKYRVCFEDKHTIVDLSDHPAITGEWLGEPLDFLGPSYVGKHSDAAGAYQIIKPTWISLKRMLGLSDFQGPSQDAGAVELIRETGAIPLIEGGQIVAAIAKCRNIWASLPGSTSGQPIARTADLLAFYASAGGARAALS